MRRNLYKYLPGLIVVLIAIIVTAATYKDYGISWDEPVQREMGIVSYNFIFKGDTTLNNYIERDHGVGFELPLIILEQKVVKPVHSREIYQLRHLATNLFFLLSVFAAYILCLRLFKNQFVAVTGMLLLLLSPRMYAHSFINSKDIPLLSAFIFVFLFAALLFETRKWHWFVLAGLACGYATAIRILGIVPIVPIFLLVGIDTIVNIRDKKVLYSNLIGTALFFIAAFIAVYIAWPTLWGHPVDNFIEAFKSMSHFRWEYSLKFMGEDILSSKLPWYYLPYWILISVPELCVVFGFLGSLGVVISLFKSRFRDIINTPQKNFLMYLFCFWFPIAAILYKNSIVYDDWRHVYFIYPSLVFIALWLINMACQTRLKWAMWVAVCIQFAGITIFMVKSHPFQQVYFNRFVSHAPESHRDNFDYEYWGASYKQGIDYIMQHDTSSKVRIFESTYPVMNAYLSLPEHEQQRVQFLNRQDTPYYFITTFRGGHEGFEKTAKVIYERKVQNSTVMRVYWVE